MIKITDEIIEMGADAAVAKHTAEISPERAHRLSVISPSVVADDRIMEEFVRRFHNLGYDLTVGQLRTLMTKALPVLRERAKETE